MTLEALVCFVFLDMLVRRDPRSVSGRRFRMRCDNQPWVVAVNKGKSNEPRIALLLGWLHKLQAGFRFAFDVEFISTTDNYLADALSRAQLDRFRAEARTHWSNTAPLVAAPSPWQGTRQRSWSSQLVSTRRSQA